MTPWDQKSGSLALPVLRAFYENGGTPEVVFGAVLDRINDRGPDPAWIALRKREEVLADVGALKRADIIRKPLWGVPFGVKDNLDLVGMATTNGCRAHTRQASATTPIVQRLIDAGAIPVGKNNMDQFGVGSCVCRENYLQLKPGTLKEVSGEPVLAFSLLGRSAQIIAT